MRRILVVSLAVAIILVVAFASTELLLPTLDQTPQPKKSIFHVGVSFCGNTTAEAKLLIDRVKNFTNLFVVQSGPVSVNETALNEIVDYAVASGLNVIVYFGYFNPLYSWQVPWLDYAKQQWGSRFLGVYLHDEPGGQVLDYNWTGYLTQLKISDVQAYYSHVPGIDLELNIVNGSELYNELMTAYMAGAQYAAIFDYPQIDNNPYGILTDEHFTALQKFWNNIQTLNVNSQAQAALVLPQDYGWGMRDPQDTIWGLWKPDATSVQIWNISQKLEAQYGLGSDIVYDDPMFPVQGKGYKQIYYWNQTQ